MQNRAGPTWEICSWYTSSFGNVFLEFFRGKKYFSEPPNFFQAALSGPVRMVWSAPVTVGWGAIHSQSLLAGPIREISSIIVWYVWYMICTRSTYWILLLKGRKVKERRETESRDPESREQRDNEDPKKMSGSNSNSLSATLLWYYGTRYRTGSTNTVCTV